MKPYNLQSQLSFTFCHDESFASFYALRVIGVDCTLGLQVHAPGVFTTAVDDTLTFSATVGGIITADDLANPSASKSMTLKYSASVPDFAFDASWSMLGVPEMKATSFPSDGNTFDMYLDEEELITPGVCIADASTHVQADGVLKSDALEAAAANIVLAAGTAGADLCAAVEDIVLDPSTGRASLQLVVTIDMFDGTYIVLFVA